LSTHTLSGRWTREDRLASRYQELAFEVGPGAAAVAVELEFDRSGDAVVDLGCLGPEGAFRGWSGGARDRFVILPDAATPGYLPGPLEPGTWKALLGLHRVPEAGVAWRVTVTVSTVRPEADLGHQGAPIDALLDPARNASGTLRPQGLGVSRGFPAPPGMRWIAGDLHSHTVHSDGVLGVEGIARVAAARGLDYLAVTDHNTVSHHPFLEQAGKSAGIVLVPGQEVTSLRGHANAFGAIGRIEFRESPGLWGRRVAAAGGLFSVNHPLGGDCSWREPVDEALPLAEVWHSEWRAYPRHAGPLAWWITAPSQSTAIGGSDFHRPGDNAEPGEPTTWLLVEEPTVDGIIHALAQGRAAVSADPLGPVLLRMDGDLVALGAEGLVLTGPGRPSIPVRSDRASWPADPGKYWLETHDGVVMALTS
jgi:hypothetical protein